MAGAVGVPKSPRSDINITPLVDVVLVLLIIFMVLTPLMEKEMFVRVPEENTELTPPPPPDQQAQQIVMRVKEDGRVYINNEQMTEENLGQRLHDYYRRANTAEAKAKNGPPVIFFDAEDKAKYGQAVKALDAIRDSSPGWTIGMMTEKIKSDEGGGPTPPETPGTAPPPGAPLPPGAPPAPPPK